MAPGSAQLPGYRIRWMRPEDAEAASGLSQAVFDLPWTREHFVTELHRPLARAWVVEDTTTGEVVGFLVLWLVADQAEIATVAVAPDHRRRGLARALMDRALREACAQGARQVDLEVRADNQAALALYHSLGFQVTGRRRGYYYTPRGPTDALLMRRPCRASNGG
ncbi:MAG: ribosomal protein S18-alanine N-acetyltransferase [Chloroflexi bacterium]|nr:ribosomal protein S18-alanine N-acetyltransferase [Chloroflexota bacterium]